MSNRTYPDGDVFPPNAPQAVPDTTASEGDWGPLSDLPGNPMIWLLILSELAVFGALFGGFAAVRLLKAEIYVASQSALDPIAAGIATLALVTSGWLAAWALETARQGRNPRPLLLASMGIGATFLIAKIYEYAGKFDQGIGIDANPFWTLYYLSTGFHALHVVLGIVALGLLCRWPSVENIETGTAFWHMVDVIWIVLYSIVYLVRA